MKLSHATLLMLFIVVLTHTFFLDVLKKISLICSELYNYHENKFMNILQWAVKLSWKQIRLIIFRHMVPFNASYLEIKVPLYGHEKLVLSFFWTNDMCSFDFTRTCEYLNFDIVLQKKWNWENFRIESGY
jgi:hypothetical protein